MRSAHFYSFILILWSAVPILFSSCANNNDRERQRDYVSEFRSVDKLTLAEMTVTKMGSIDDLRPDDASGIGETVKAWLNSLKIGSRKGAWSYSTYMRAYVDMSKLKPEDMEVSQQDKVMRITMPEIEVEFIGRDVSFKEEHYRVTGLRSNISAADRARLKEEMNKLLKHEVEERPQFRKKLTETARAKGEEYFKALGASSGYEVELTWK